MFSLLLKLGHGRFVQPNEQLQYDKIIMLEIMVAVNNNEILKLMTDL